MRIESGPGFMVSSGALSRGFPLVRDLPFWVGDCGGNNQLDLGTRIGLIPNSQFSTHKFGSFMHTRQAVMCGEAALVQHLWVDTLPVVPDVHPKLPFVVTDIHFDPLGAGMTEGIAQRLGRNPIDFVPEDRSELPGCAFHVHTKVGRIPAVLISGEPLSESADRPSKVVRDRPGRTQTLPPSATPG